MVLVFVTVLAIGQVYKMNQRIAKLEQTAVRFPDGICADFNSVPGMSIEWYGIKGPYSVLQSYPCYIKREIEARNRR